MEKLGVAFIGADRIYTVVAVVVFASLAKNLEEYRLAFDGAILVTAFLAASVLAVRTSYIFGLNKNGVGSSLAATFVIAFEMCLSAGKKRQWFYVTMCCLVGIGCLAHYPEGHGWLRPLGRSFCLP